MKLTLNWLREFVDLPSDPCAVADVLEGLGFEVEEMQRREATFTGVVVGEVLEVGRHPNADKVRVCQVDVGGTIEEIVCGAWNFAAGAHVPVALPGARLGDFEISRRSIRGVVSNGMICSEAELGIGEEEQGIMVLDRDYPEAASAVGTDFTALLPFPDTIYDIAINPNRPDCMSVLGLARELAAYYDIPLRIPDFRVEAAPGPGVTVTIDDPIACPRFVGRAVDGITVGPSPHWMRMRLNAAGMRAISNVVDASNYAMIEVGHPTHAFDRDRLGDRIVVRRATPGESIVTLDEETRELLPGDIVVASSDRPVAIAGVMGGADTEVNDGTTSVLIEAAYWDPPSILMTSKRLGLRSEASARFERGMDPEFCVNAANRVAQLLEKIGGGTIGGIVDEYPGEKSPAEIALSTTEIERVLGVAIPVAEGGSILRRLGFAVTEGDPLMVEVPSRRPDVTRPVDLIEEIARLHGYDKIPKTVATGTGGGLPAIEAKLRKLRDIVAGAGYAESMTFSFIGKADLDALQLPPGDPRRDGIRVVNPLRDEEGVMRTTLLPGLIKAAKANLDRHLGEVSLFEIGAVFLSGDGKIPEQPRRLAFLTVGERDGDWESPGRPVDIRDATGLWELLSRHLEIPSPGVQRTELAPLHPGRGAAVTTGGEVVGFVGELHPRVTATFGISARVVVGELDLGPLLAPRPQWMFRPPSPYPPAVFDLAFELDESVPVGEVLRAVDGAGAGVVERRSIFDIFRGGPLQAGNKSVAVHIVLRHPERTLTDKQVTSLRSQIIAAVEEATGGQLRGEA